MNAMTKHIPRKSRWTQLGPNEHRSAEGRVYFRAGQWFAEVHYRVQDSESAAPAELQTWLAGKFKRPRNAMIALEDRVTELQRRHGAHVTFIVA
jgi:hypothetical protein